MKRRIDKFDSLPEKASEEAGDLVLLEDDPVGALLARKKRDMPLDADRQDSSDLESETKEKTDVLVDDRKRLVSKEKDPIMPLVTEKKNEVPTDASQDNPPPEDDNTVQGSPTGPEAVVSDDGEITEAEQNSPAPADIKAEEDTNSATTNGKEAPAVSTVELKTEDTDGASVEDSDVTLVQNEEAEEATEMVEASLETEQPESEPKPEETANKSNKSGGLLDIFYEEGAGEKSFQHQDLIEIDINSLHDEAKQIINILKGNR